MNEAEIRAAMGALWVHRGTSEREAHARFKGLVGRLWDVGANRSVIEMALEASGDEVRHAAICDGLARHFDTEPQLGNVGAPPELAPAELPPRQRVLYDVVAFCCLAETMNAALLATTLKHVRDDVVRRAVRRILKDEVKHSRLGWAHLAWERSGGSCELLAECLPRMLEGAITEEIERPRALTPDAPRLLHYGSLPRATRLALFQASLRDVIFPGLRAHGVSTRQGEAWVAAAFSRQPDLDPRPVERPLR